MCVDVLELLNGFCNNHKTTTTISGQKNGGPWQLQSFAWL